MKLLSHSGELKHQHFVIEHDEKVGFYLYVFEGDHCKFDYLQDTLEQAIEQAFDEFQVPRDSWRRAE